MPIPSLTCSQPELCCDNLWDSMCDLLDHLVEKMEPCLGDPGGCSGPPIQPFVSHGPPDLGLTDYLTVWWDVGQSRQSANDPRGNILLPISEYTVYAQLVESNYPTIGVEGQEATVPSFEALHAANRIATAHAERLWRAMIDARSVLPGCGKDFKSMRMEPVLPGRGVIGGSIGTRVSIFAVPLLQMR